MQLPMVAVHYHMGDRAPFLNLSDLDAVGLDRVLADLARYRAELGLKRIFGPRYMDLRRLTEARLLECFISVGGKPERRAPHYLCLGPCEWFRRLAPEMKQVSLPLSALPDDVTSFTYPDSFTSMGFLPRFGIAHVERPYHGRVFRMHELADVVGQYGLPLGDADEDYEGYHRREFEKYIEIQVWSDAPVRSWLERD